MKERYMYTKDDLETRTKELHKIIAWVFLLGMFAGSALLFIVWVYANL